MARTIADKKLLKLARARWDQADEAEQDQRQREVQDLRFYAGDQWDPLARQARSGQPANATNGLPPVPARPCLTINKVREPVRQVLNAERQSDFGIELVAADDFGELGPHSEENKKEIEIREGLVRRIQRSSEAQDARSWAFGRATQAGRGYYQIMTRYVPGMTFDQEIFVNRIYNQASVLLDPAHEQPDGSDANWEFVGRDMPYDEYKAEYGDVDGKKNAVTGWTDDEWRSYGDLAPGWFTSEGETRSCRVVDYWYTEFERYEIGLTAAGDILPMRDWPADEPKPDAEHRRWIVERTIKWCKIDGYQVIERTDWPGPDMPTVKVLGEELQPYDDERRVEGMVRQSRDAQEGYNAMISKLVETVGLTPIPPLLVAAGTVEQYKEWYQAATTRALPYLPYDTVDVRGQPAPQPTRANVDVPIQALSASVQMFDQAIQATTVPDVRIGQLDPSITSGRAIDLLRKQAQQGTSHYLDNLRRSIRYEGQIINNLLYPIYGTRPGRLARIITGQGETQTVVIGQPGGVPAQAQLAGPVLGLSGAPAAPAQTYTLTPDANFNVIVKVTRSYDSRREEESDTVGQLIQARPEMMTWFGDLFFKNQDGPGHEAMAERARVMLAPPIQQMLATEQQGGEPLPPQAQAQIGQLQQQLQAAHQLLQKFAEDQKTEKVKHDAQIQIKQIEAQRDLQLQQMKDATSIAVAEVNARAKGVQSVNEAALEALATGQQQAHEAAEAEADRQHEAAMAAAGAAQAQQMAAQQPPPNGGPPNAG